MSTFYLLLFFIGLIYAVISFALGNLLDFGDADLGDMSLDMDGSPADLNFSWTTLFPLQPATIVAFITVLGGLGTMGLMLNLNPFLVFFFSLACGWAIAQGIQRLIIVPLRKVQAANAISQDQIIGVRARVISSIQENGFGTISYLLQSSSYNAPARHVEGKYLPLNSEVIICMIENEVFFVTEID